MKVGWCSHTGQVRKINEDWVLSDPELNLYAVADGMGGHDAGEVASRMAVECLQTLVSEGLREAAGAGPAVDLTELVRSAFVAANREVLAHAGRNSSDMATTLTSALVRDDLLVLGHIGDSRAYRIRKDAIEQISDDHSLVAELVRQGVLNQEQAQRHPRKNVVTRAIGTYEESSAPDVQSFQLESEDRILLCSDGLTNVLSNEEILEVVLNHSDPGEATQELVDRVNARGAPDNVSVLLMQGPWRTGSGQRKKARPALHLLLILAIPLLVGIATLALARNCYFLGTAGNHVAVYRGLPGMPSLLTARTPVQITQVTLDDCMPPYRERLRKGIPLSSLREASDRIARIQVSPIGVAGRAAMPPMPATTPAPQPSP